MLRCIGVGDNVCDKYRHLGRMFPGGQALNFAVYCRMLGQESAYLGAFGSDGVGAHVKSTLDALGVDRSRCREYPGENGFAEVDLQNGDRVFLCSNKGGVLREHPLELDAADLAYLSAFDVIHTSNNSYMDRNLPLLKTLPPLLSYDFSGAWKDEARLQAVCESADIVFLSCSELTDSAAAALTENVCARGCKTAVATMGARGALVLDGGEHTRFTPRLVEAVDTLGAGDSLAAGFLVEYAQARRAGLPAAGTEQRRALVLRALNAGAALSARTCLTQGAFGHGTELI